MSQPERFGPDTFGDGTPLPPAAHAVPDDGLPKLDDTVALDGTLVKKGAYRLAREAQARGEPYVFIEASGAGRQWAPTVSAFGVRALVVGRTRDAVALQRQREGVGVDSGAVGRVLLRFSVVEVLLAWKRAELKRLNPEPRRLRMNERRRRPCNVMIR